METQEKKKYNKGGSVLRCEPQSLKLVNFDPEFRVSFEQVGCMRFCEKIQGFNVQFMKEFALNFNGVQTNIVDITFHLSEETVVATTEIPVQGEKWFKGMPLDPTFYTNFLETHVQKVEFWSYYSNRMHIGAL